MPTIKINDINLYYETHGSGQPLVLIAGFSGDHTTWLTVIDALARNYQVIVFDNRGIGKSDCPLYPYNTEMMADDVIKLLEALQIDSAHIVGHSFGGCIAQTIAYKRPDLVNTLVLSNSLIKANMRLRLFCDIRLELTKANAPRDTILKFISTTCWSNQFLSKSGQLEQLIKAGVCPITNEGYENQLAALLSFDSSEWIKKINRPTLVITSDEDLLADLDDACYIVNAIEPAELFCFENVGHIPMVEHPGEFNKILLDFLQRQGG